jgi:hypothetical protein
VLVEELAGVHPVDMVGPEHEDVLGGLVVDEVEVLVDGVGGAGEPPPTPAHLRGNRRDVVVQQRREPPRPRDVQVEAVALVLRQDDDLEEAAVRQVRQDEVDEPVMASEWHGRLGPVGGQGGEALALAAGQHHREDAHRSPP